MPTRVSGTSSCWIASRVASQRAELQEFLMSRVTTKQSSLMPPCHLVPSIAFEAMSFTVEIASTVDLDFLKPNCG